MRPRDPDLEPWHFVPVEPKDEERFRQWNVTIITLLLVLVIGLFTIGLLPGVTVDHAFSASHSSATQYTP